MVNILFAHRLNFIILFCFNFMIIIVLYLNTCSFACDCYQLCAMLSHIDETKKKKNIENIIRK